MGGFLYFFPGKTSEELSEDLSRLPRPAAEVLHDVHKFPQDGVICNVHANGPDLAAGGHGAGCLIVPANANGLPSIAMNAPGKQQWHNAGDYWIGWIRGETPGPLDLERPKTIRGLKVTDDVGGEWNVPVARSPLKQFGTLPKTFSFGTDGKIEEHLEEAWQWLWDFAGQVQETWRSAASDAELVSYVPTILGVNYRVGPNELNALRAAGGCKLSEVFVARITSTLLHHDILIEAAEQKKTESSEPPVPPS